jgi:hypothetical protein
MEKRRPTIHSGLETIFSLWEKTLSGMETIFSGAEKVDFG